jgi:2-polyprenyl-3-methyl-5-hydroxy-6-metoxy-1,4-benzoquinol methylase
MDECCDPRGPEGYDDVFDERYARGVAQRYLRKGPTATERRIVEFLAANGLSGASVLEVGGGIGVIQLELLARGASRTVNLELSSAYEEEAQTLISRAGAMGRVTRILGVDLAREPQSVEPADVVVLHRVVCCYPDHERLLSAAADHARSVVVFSHPPRSWIMRTGVCSDNLLMRLTGRSYRGFVHPPDAMVDVVRRRGFVPRYRYRGFAWSVVGAVRA